MRNPRNRRNRRSAPRYGRAALALRLPLGLGLSLRLRLQLRVLLFLRRRQHRGDAAAHLGRQFLARGGALTFGWK